MERKNSIGEIMAQLDKLDDNELEYLSQWSMPWGVLPLLHAFEDGKLMRDMDCDTHVLLECQERDEELEKWRDLVWKLYAALSYARQFGEFCVVDGAVVDGILIGCSGIIEELPQFQEVQFWQMQSAADMLKQSQRWDEAQATADMLEKLNSEIARKSLNGAWRGCPMCEEERRKESQDEQG